MYGRGGFGAQIPTYEWERHSDIIGADGTSLLVPGFRAIFFNMLSDTIEAVGITFTACDVQAPIIAFSHMLTRGYVCSLTSERMELQVGNDFKIIPAANPNSLFASMRPERRRPGVTLCILSQASTSIIISTITIVIISSTGDDGDGAKHSEGAIDTRGEGNTNT